MGGVTLSNAETVAAPPAPTTADGLASTEELRFLQERLALLAKVMTILDAGSLLVVIAMHVLMGQVQYTVTSHVIQAGSVLVTAIAWIYLRGPARAESTLKMIDGAFTVAVILSLDTMSAFFPRVARPDHIIALITMMITLGRAVLVPSSPRRTFIVSVVAWLPAFPIAYFIYSAPEAAQEVNLSFILAESLVNTLIFSASSVGLATVAARVIYGLRREVREAQKLGQYTLITKLGEGGMGQVFRARHAMLRRPTAVKLLHPERVGGAEDLARFEREVQLTAQLAHPNVVTVFDYGRTPDGVFYYAMELLEGQNLEDIVGATGPMTASRAVHVLTQVASALAEAHSVGLIHRDIKPANIILCARGSTMDVAKVVDFGLVKHVGGPGHTDAAPAAIVANDTKPEEADAPISSGVLSRTGTVLGTPMYLAPEAMRDPASVDGRADLYALGAVAYFLLTGTTVFGGATVMEACRHHLFTKPEPPSQRLREKYPDSTATIPADLEAIVLKLLAKDPENRTQSAAELVAELEACEVARTWSNDDARAWWAHSRKGDAPAEAKSEETSWSAKTIAVDLAR